MVDILTAVGAADIGFQVGKGVAKRAAELVVAELLVRRIFGKRKAEGSHDDPLNPLNPGDTIDVRALQEVLAQASAPKKKRRTKFHRLVAKEMRAMKKSRMNHRVKFARATKRASAQLKKEKNRGKKKR